MTKQIYKDSPDAQAKKVLSYGPALSRLLTQIIEEYKGQSLEDMETKYIDPLAKNPDALFIYGLKNDNGDIRMDLIFRAFLPESSKKVGIFIDLEPQGKVDTEYPLISRALFYCAQHLYEEKDRIFTKSEYGKIEKIVSIWICTDAPKKYANTIVRYSIQEEMMDGDSIRSYDREDYDLMEVYMVYLNREVEDHGIYRMLNCLLRNDDRTDEQRTAVLTEEFGMDTKPLKGEFEKMATIEESIRSESKAEGREEGRAEGITLGSRKTYVTTLKECNIPEDDTVIRFASKFNVSLDEAKKAVKDYWK